MYKPESMYSRLSIIIICIMRICGFSVLFFHYGERCILRTKSGPNRTFKSTTSASFTANPRDGSTDRAAQLFRTNFLLFGVFTRFNIHYSFNYLIDFSPLYPMKCVYEQSDVLDFGA